MLDRWFLLEDRDDILSIPLSSSSMQDRLIWAGNKSGKFTVKSAYALALEEKTPNTIWQMKALQKIKHFAWKAGRNILATKSNLAQ